MQRSAVCFFMFRPTIGSTESTILKLDAKTLYKTCISEIEKLLIFILRKIKLCLLINIHVNAKISTMLFDIKLITIGYSEKYDCESMKLNSVLNSTETFKNLKNLVTENLKTHWLEFLSQLNKSVISFQIRLPKIYP